MNSKVTLILSAVLLTLIQNTLHAMPAADQIQSNDHPIEVVPKLAVGPSSGGGSACAMNFCQRMCKDNPADGGKACK